MVYIKGHSFSSETLKKISETQKKNWREHPEKYSARNMATSKRMKGNKWNWRGGIIKHSQGYICILQRNHPRAYMGNGYVKRAVLIAEKFLGRPLMSNEYIHHINQNREDDRPENLYVCQNRSEHIKIHKRKSIVFSNLILNK